MLRKQFVFAAIIGALAAASPVAAQTQGVNTGGTWSNMTKPTNGGSAFWDNTSLDGNACNVGYFLLYRADAGFGPCNNMKPDDAFVRGRAGRLGLNISGAPNGSYLNHTNFSFKSGHYRVEFLGNIAGYGPTGQNPQQLGIFTNGVGGPIMQQQIYASGAYPNGLTTVFDVTLTDDWFLGAHHVASVNPWDFTSNTGPDHGWALFSSYSANNQPGGADDTMWAAFGDVEAGDQDYNDLMVQVTSVPEPSSAALLVMGVAALAMLARRARRSKVAA